jgi:hypothetical protein
MNTVSAFSRSVNPSFDEVCSWLEKKSASGEVPKSSSRLAITALRQLTTVLQEDEPRDVDHIADNLASLSARWQNLNPDKRGDTARTYESRARWALEAYRAWKADPTGFRFKKKEARSDGESRVRKPVAEKRDRAPGAPAPEAPTTAGHGTAPNPGTQRSLPLGTGRGEFRFELPANGLEVRDVMRITYHLITLCEDFDPSAPSQAQLFSIIRRGEV